METISAERFVVETPENIRFGYDTADIGSRFLAILIDSLIQGALYVILFIAALILQNRATAAVLPRWANDALGVSVILALFVIQFGYFLFFETILNGETPGKRLFHLRVVKANGYPLAPLDSIVRNLVRIIDFFPLFYGVGVVTMFSNPRAKRLGDFAAGTIVVKLRDPIRLEQLDAPPKPAAAQTGSAPDSVSKLDDRDVEMAASFLRRRQVLVNADALGLQIAQRLAAKMGAPDSPKTLEAAVVFLRDTVDAFRARQ